MDVNEEKKIVGSGRGSGWGSQGRCDREVMFL